MTDTEKTELENKPSYKQASGMVDEWLKLHQGETFDLDLICRQLTAVTREERQIVATKLNNDYKHGRLEKNNKIYRFINKTTVPIPWHTSTEDYFDITYPSNHHEDDLTYFGFSKAVKISPGALIVIAGVGNSGKSTFCRNILWDNMHRHHCLYMSSETTGPAFRRYALNMKWQNWQNGNGQPCFELVERYREYQDIVQPDSINIIDWFNVESGEFYNIGIEMKRIQEKLRNGIALIAIQKSPGKDLGRGGDFSKEYASLYLTIDYDAQNKRNRITVAKSKEWIGEHDPNDRVYDFQITDYGTQFSNIREVKKCQSCYGSGKTRGNQCITCSGLGWTEVYRCSNKVEGDLNF